LESNCKLLIFVCNNVMKYFLNFTGFRIQDADSRQQGSSLIYPQLRHCATACADVPRHLMRGAPTQAEPVVPQGQTSKCRLQRLDIMYSSFRRTSCFSFSCNKNKVSSATPVAPSRHMGATWPTNACCRNTPERGGATSSQPRRPRPMLKIVPTVDCPKGLECVMLEIVALRPVDTNVFLFYEMFAPL